MAIKWPRLAAGLLLVLCFQPVLNAVELTVSRGALERTLKNQLFSGPDGRYYLKGDAQSGCFTYAQDPQLSFVQDRIVVHVKTNAHLGRKVGGVCIGIALASPAEVSFAPAAEGEAIGFRDARIDSITTQKELNFLLMPFLGHRIPSGMKVNAADLLRKALADSTVSSGYAVNLSRFRILSIHVQGDNLVVEADGDITVK